MEKEEGTESIRLATEKLVLAALDERSSPVHASKTLSTTSSSSSFSSTSSSGDAKYASWEKKRDSWKEVGEGEAAEAYDSLDQELAMIRALLHAEETNDFSQISSAQSEILSSDSLGRDLPRSFKTRETLEQQPGQAPLPPSTTSSGKNRLAPKLSEIRDRFLSGRNFHTKKSEEEKGLDEREMAGILGSEKEEDYVAQVKVALEHAYGSEFFEEHEQVVEELDFWARACLRARRFRVKRAVELVHNYALCKATVETYLEQDATAIKRVRRLLERGVVYFHGSARCKMGRGIISFHASRHDPKLFSAHDIMVAVHAVITHAIRAFPVLQAIGFTLVHDMTGVSLKNFDANLPKVISRVISSRIPLRYGQIIAVNPPTFYSAVFRVVSMFMSPKMRSRAVKVYFDPSKHGIVNPLEKYIQYDHLPVHLGGASEPDFAVFAHVIFPFSQPELDEQQQQSEDAVQTVDLEDSFHEDEREEGERQNDASFEDPPVEEDEIAKASLDLKSNIHSALV